MADRKDVKRMSERELLSEIYNKLYNVEGKVELLDDIVRGDTDRGVEGLQRDVLEIKQDVHTFKQAKLVRQTIITSVASLITVLASLATIISLAWQGS